LAGRGVSRVTALVGAAEVGLGGGQIWTGVAAGGAAPA